MNKEFELFKRENPSIDGIAPDGKNLLIKWPIYRHFNDIPERDAINDLGSVPNNTPPTTTETPESPATSPVISPTEGTDGEGPDGEGPDGEGPDGEGPDGEGNGGGEGENRNACNFDEKGNFNAYATANTEETSLDYKYKVETYSDGVSVKDEVVPFLEKMILQIIVPKIFDCEGGRLLSSGLRHRDRRLALAGASAGPADSISEVECAAANNGEECHYVDGRMTLFTFDSNDSELSTVQDLICDALNSDTLKFSHPSITRLACIKDGNVSGNGIGTNEINNGAPAATQTYTTSAALLSSLAAIMVVFGVYAYRRGSKDDKSLLPDHRPHLDDSDINNSNSISFDDLPMAWSTQSSKTKSPAFDMSSIIPKGCPPETINECEEEEEHQEEDESNLDEVSLDQLSMNLDESNLS